MLLSGLVVAFVAIVSLRYLEVAGEIASVDPGLNSIHVSWKNPAAPKEVEVIVYVEKSDNPSKGKKSCKAYGASSTLGCTIDGLEKATLYTAYLESVNGNVASKDTVNIMTTGEDVCKNMDKEMFTIITLAVAVGIMIFAIAVMLLCIICRSDKDDDMRRTRKVRKSKERSYRDDTIEYKKGREIDEMQPKVKYEIDGRKLYASTLSSRPQKPPPYQSKKKTTKTRADENGDLEVERKKRDNWEMKERGGRTRNGVMNENMKGAESGGTRGAKATDYVYKHNDDVGNDEARDSKQPGTDLNGVQLYQSHAYFHDIDYDNVDTL